MTTRKNSRRTGSLDKVLDNLPAHLLTPVATVENGSPVGLRDYMKALGDHLDAAGPGRDRTVEVMTALGIPPSEWYRAMMS